MKKQDIISGLILMLQKIPVNILAEEIPRLDYIRKEIVLNKLLPQKFQELIRYIVSKDQETGSTTAGHLWSFGTKLDKGLKVELLDTLNPLELICLGRKDTAGNNSFGYWFDFEEIKPTKKVYNLSNYLFFCKKERILEFVEFLAESTAGVRAAKDREFDDFAFKASQFPYEAIGIFSLIHPKVLFPALNMLSLENFKRILHLCEIMLDNRESIENVFCDEYDKEAFLDTDTVAEHIGKLENKKLFLLLKMFSSDNQFIICEKLGENRLIQMNKEKCLNREITMPNDFHIFLDKVPNEKIEENLMAGKIKISQLKPKKVVELIGQLAS